MMYVRLVDAAEVILREDGPAALTAAAVATSAGMYRSSTSKRRSSIDSTYR